MSTAPEPARDNWPELPVNAWEDTRATVHMWLQIIGKIRLAQMPMMNHWWQVPLYATASGLTTSPMPYGDRVFEIVVDFIEHKLVIGVDDGRREVMALAPRSVADFYRELIGRLRGLGLEPRIWTTPCEVAAPIPFEADRDHAAYDPEYVNRFWRVLLQATRVLTEFRAGFLGKVSPVHFFWGSFDLAVTRFSGRAAPPHPGAPNVADRVTREAYSHEVSSAGFWPGTAGVSDAVFYAYAYPEPAGFGAAPVAPAAAGYNRDLGEFILPYAAMRSADQPEAALHEFLATTYAAAAELGGWDRTALERG